MRIYTLPSGTGHDAVAPELPGTWYHAPAAAEAVAGCRRLVAEDLAAYAAPRTARALGPRSRRVHGAALCASRRRP